MKQLYDGLFTQGNYKETLTQKIDELIVQDLSDDFKMVIIEAITDAYIDQTGKVPDSFELSRLTTWLVEDKTNDPHKVAKTEYPILSTDQIKLRWKRETVREDIGGSSISSKHKMNGKRKPKSFKVFGEYEGGY